jgi:tetratricopeptide (TPR) repeat protein
LSDEPPRQASVDDAEFTRLCDQVSLQLRLNHIPSAAKLSEELLAGWPDSTTAHELAGDVALSQGKVAAARKHYQQALQIEPANIDAERKYGLALVTQTADERRSALLNEVIADPTAHRSSPRKPLNAVINSLLFPGLGQLYNREHEKGLMMLGGGALMVMLAFYLLVQVPYQGVVQSAEKHGLNVNEQIEGARQTMQGQGVGYWLLVTLVIVAFALLYMWGVYDAWRHAQSETDRTLGVH